MRVALCFSGQFRNVRQTYENHWVPMVFNHNTHHQIDVFVHSWYDKSTAGQVLMTAAGNRGSEPVPANIITDVYEMYNPISMMTQQQLPFDEKNYKISPAFPFITPRFSLSRMYSSWMCNQLKLAHEMHMGFKYDVVVTTRFDWVFRAPLQFDRITHPGIYHPGLNPHGTNIGCIIGQSSFVDHYNNLYWDVEQLYNSGVPFCDEILAESYLTAHKVPIYNLSIPTTINRG